MVAYDEHYLLLELSMDQFMMDISPGYSDKHPGIIQGSHRDHSGTLLTSYPTPNIPLWGSPAQLRSSKHVARGANFFTDMYINDMMFLQQHIVGNKHEGQTG